MPWSFLQLSSGFGMFTVWGPSSCDHSDLQAKVSSWPAIYHPCCQPLEFRFQNYGPCQPQNYFHVNKRFMCPEGSSRAFAVQSLSVFFGLHFGCLRLCNAGPKTSRGLCSLRCTGLGFAVLPPFRAPHTVGCRGLGFEMRILLLEAPFGAIMPPCAKNMLLCKYLEAAEDCMLGSSLAFGNFDCPWRVCCRSVEIRSVGRCHTSTAACATRCPFFRTTGPSLSLMAAPSTGKAQELEDLRVRGRHPHAGLSFAAALATRHPADRPSAKLA